MINETIQQLFDRKSIRVYLDKDIPEKDKALILQAAVQIRLSRRRKTLYRNAAVFRQALPKISRNAAVFRQKVQILPQCCSFSADFTAMLQLFGRLAENLTQCCNFSAAPVENIEHCGNRPECGTARQKNINSFARCGFIV